ncbi:MAG: DUF934 domain-containing protein [Gammaproteobacteria bacterium]|nr:DUF934 domain-containing protein [Gammaproteobacteria bacterium]
MALVKDGRIVEDAFVDASTLDTLPPQGCLIVSLEQWQAHRHALLARAEPVGIKLTSDQSPEAIAEDVGCFDVIALEFPRFRDGRAYSYARLLRERYGYDKELRAVGDVLLEQLFYMARTGFDAFEILSPDPLRDFETAMGDFSVCYQPTGDGRPTAMQLRHRRPAT